MLRELNIENVAIIEKAVVSFGSGLNVLTGETGAGKSILIDSINRTTREIVRSGANKSVIWAEFENINPKYIRTIEEQGYECDGSLILHREITADGKSVCRINGKPATAQTVRDVCSNLINIHGQHDNQDLLNPERHIYIIDNFASLGDEVSNFSELYDKLVKVKADIEKFNMDESDKERRIDLLNYQIDEIVKAELSVDEEQELADKRTLIRNSEKLIESLRGAYALLSGDGEEEGALSSLYSAMSRLEDINGMSGDIDGCASKISDAYYSLSDVSSDIGRIQDEFGFDANDLNDVEERLDLIYKLKRKYGDSIEEILSYCEQAAKELEGIESSDKRLIELTAECKRLSGLTNEAAKSLGEKRHAAIPVFEGRIKDELSYLNMPNVSFNTVCREGSLTRRGTDVIEFFISPNAGEQPKPLSKIASGGELSRIMLAIKNSLAEKDDVDTLIFDEIDTGVSGSAAAKIGRKLKQSAAMRQTICVTHSAQIASFCDTHLFIAKMVKNGRTFTDITELDYDGRKHELARIISGDNITPTSLQNAEEMLELSRKD